MIGKDTLPEIYRPMMGRPSLRLPYCAVCGRAANLEQHHIVRRGAGKLFDCHGREVAKPTVTLCGFGSNLRDADGRFWCHGRAHHNMVHFRWVEACCTKPKGKAPLGALDTYEMTGGHWEVIELDEPTSYIEALAMDGWRRL